MTSSAQCRSHVLDSRGQLSRERVVVNSLKTVTQSRVSSSDGGSAQVGAPAVDAHLSAIDEEIAAWQRESAAAQASPASAG